MELATPTAGGPSAARATHRGLARDYTTAGTGADGLLAHGVYDHPAGDGVDECTLWGDYFYLEGLVRAGAAFLDRW